MKDNAHILSNPDDFRATLERARETFSKLDGVLSVGFGQKSTGGRYKDDIAITVYVREKKTLEDIPPDQRIPPSFEGYVTDVKTVLTVQPGGCNNDASYDSIQGGIQIVTGVEVTNNTLSSELGTLGCIVKKRGDSGRENVYLLSNKHVLFAKGAGPGDYVYHPYPPSPPPFAARESKALGPIQAIAFYADVAYRAPNATTDDQYFVDAAFGRLDLDSKCCGSTCTKDTTHYAESVIDLVVNGANTVPGPIVDVRNVAGDATIISQKVVKVGRRTGRTVGIVRSVTATVSTHDPTVAGNPAVTVHNNIEIDFDVTTTTPNNCLGHARFAETGDSGSLVLDEQGRAIGLISQVPEDSAPSAASATACHIVPVLDRLGICIPCTTGTSYGSSRATDGSGIAPATTADSGMVDGQIGFGEDRVTSSLVGPPAWPEPIPVTDEEAAHMRELLATFRETARGREIHESVAEVRREVGYLVRNSRHVKSVWHRNKGPAFMAQVINHLRGEVSSMPHEIGGYTREMLLTRMRDALAKHGSNPLRRALEQHADLLPLLISPDMRTAHDGIAALEKMESP